MEVLAILINIMNLNINCLTINHLHYLNFIILNLIQIIINLAILAILAILNCHYLFKFIPIHLSLIQLLILIGFLSFINFIILIITLMMKTNSLHLTNHKITLINFNYPINYLLNNFPIIINYH